MNILLLSTKPRDQSAQLRPTKLVVLFRLRTVHAPVDRGDNDFR